MGRRSWLSKRLRILVKASAVTWGPAAIQLDQGDEKSGALGQRADLREVALANNQAAFRWPGMRRIWTSMGRWSMSFMSGMEGLLRPFLPR